ncbi:MAG: (d)CMP kinase, partial [Pseudomonadota bacterium]
VRANRRFLELRGKGADVTPDQVLADVRERDARDAERSAAPMKPAADAVILDTSDLSIDEALAKAIAMIAQTRAAGSFG